VGKQESYGHLKCLGEFHVPRAHTVSVDPKSHLVYFLLENIDGHSLLRITNQPVCRERRSRRDGLFQCGPVDDALS
jgi:hypothetical protein